MAELDFKKRRPFCDNVLQHFSSCSLHCLAHCDKLFVTFSKTILGIGYSCHNFFVTTMTKFSISVKKGVIIIKLLFEAFWPTCKTCIFGQHMSMCSYVLKCVCINATSVPMWRLIDVFLWRGGGGVYAATFSYYHPYTKIRGRNKRSKKKPM